MFLWKSLSSQLIWDSKIKFSSDCIDYIEKNIQAEFRAAFQMVHMTDNFWGFETGMITEKSLLEEKGLFLHGWFESRKQDRNKALVPRCLLSPSFKHRSCSHYSPAAICVLQEPQKICILFNISFSGISWKRGMGIHKGPKCGDFLT